LKHPVPLAKGCLTHTLTIENLQYIYVFCCGIKTTPIKDHDEHEVSVTKQDSLSVTINEKQIAFIVALRLSSLLSWPI